MLPAPKIDRRTSREIASDVRALLPVYVSNWPRAHNGGELADALIYVFARFGEFIVDRLNKTPEKNFLAFLDLLGVSPLPLQAARAPVTFYLAAGATGHAVVPAGTQIAAPPGPGEQDPVIFETEKEMVVVSAKLESLVVKDGARDEYRDFSASLAPVLPLSNAASLPDAVPGTAAAPSTGVVAAIPHILNIRLPVYPVWPPVSVIRLKIALDTDLPAPIDPRTLQWELCVAGNSLAMLRTPAGVQVSDEEAVRTIVLRPSQDETANLTKSGDVVFLNLPDVPYVVLDDLPGHWLRCRLLTPIKAKGLPGSSPGMVREEQLPGIKTLTIETLVERTGLPIEQASFNSLKLDFTKDFFPFGEKPKFGDTLYLACREAFSNPDAAITLHVTITNPSTSGLDTALPPVKPQGTKLAWEFWDGKAWTELGTARLGRIIIDRPEDAGAPFSDGTQAFSQTGDVTFRFPRPPAQWNLNGQNNYWIRVRIIGGDYGKEARYAPPTAGGAPVLTPATFAPPSIRSIKIDYTVNNASQPSALLAYNDFSYTKVSPQAGAFKPFIPVTPDQLQPSLYFGFSLPSLPATSAAFPNLPMTLYAGIEPSAPGGSPDQTSDIASANWGYWNGAGWTKCTVLDDTRGMRRSGLIRFLAPPDFALGTNFGRNQYWLRMQGGGLPSQPRISRLLLNTTIAVQGSTIANEILGASNGTPAQQFMTTRHPVLAGQDLEVREPTQPAWQERLQIRADQGEDAITPAPEPGGKGNTFWVRWLEVPNFYASGPRDRHYLLDRMSGAVTFGNGTNGMIPPALPGNLRLSYRTGGGATGNKPANAVAQLKSAIPYVEKASNCEASSGGTDLEPDSSLLVRGPLGLRHGGRAVTREDFENLAMLASREVARAKCVPLVDLAQDPDARGKKPGTVSLIIVPRSTDTKPRPTQDLFDRVRTYLNATRQLTANLVLVVPEYVRVDVECEITVSDLDAASEVELAVQNALAAYLHPVTGGRDSRGWNFGREPRRSDFYGLLESIPGVSHIRELHVSLVPDRLGSDKTGRFLICSGNHKVTTTLED